MGFGALARELTTLFAAGATERLEDDAFDALALRVFRHQFEANPVYRRFAEGRGATPEEVGGWREIPPVPTTAFKHLRLLSAPRAERVFRTSGTTRGSGRRGEHHVADLAVYRASAVAGLDAFLFHGLAPPVRILSLLPSPADAPDASLSQMVAFALEAWGDEGSGWFVDPEEGLDAAALGEAVRAAESARAPVVLAGTAFSFVHWLDTLAREGTRVRLPDGSRIMETGGFKGRSRELPRDDLYRALEERTGVPVERVVNEYGMTELLSQFWEPVLRSGGPVLPAERHHVAPPWLRTRVLDPATLEELPAGEVGLLCHHDLANVGSVAAVLTEDTGRIEGDGIRVLGRAGGAEPRGCSLAMEELMAAGGSSP